MKLKFNSNLDYQLDAIKSVTDIFEGLPIQNESIGIDLEKDLSRVRQFAINNAVQIMVIYCLRS